MTVDPDEPVVVAFAGELSLEQAPALRDSLLAAIRAGGRIVVLDLSGVSFIDQTALGVVVGARQRLVAGGGELRLAGVQQKVARVIALLGLGDALPSYPSVEAACEDPLAP